MGFNWGKFADIAKMVAPIVCVAAGLPPQLGQGIGIAIGEAQAMQHTDGTPTTNEEKKQHVMTMTQASLAATNSVLVAAGKTALPTDDIMVVADEAIDTTVAAVKTIHDKHGPDVVPVVQQ